jgi:uridine phosphorylase
MLELKGGDVAPYVLLPGDPARATRTSKLLDECKKVCDVRSYLAYTGKFNGIPVTVCSTGIGGPSASICLEELIYAGGNVFIRTGTSGKFADSVSIGDLVLVTGAARDDGTTRDYVPLEFPAVADYEVTNALRMASMQLSITVKIGLCRSGDAMCTEIRAYEKWKGKNVLCSDAETSTIFVIASLRGVKAGALLVVDGPPFEGAPLQTVQNDITDSAVDSMIRTALTAMEILEKSKPCVP